MKKKIWITITLINVISHFSSAQDFDWTASSYQNSIFRGIDEINGECYGVIVNNLSIDSNALNQLLFYKFDFLNSEDAEFSLNEISSISFPGYSTLAIKFIEETGVWILVQMRYDSANNQHYRAILCDENFGILHETTVDTKGYPLLFHIETYGSKTYILGYLLGPPKDELLFIKYNHGRPFEIGPIVISQSKPKPLPIITSMKIDHTSGNMLIFCISGIAILDSSLNEVLFLNSIQVQTSDHGHLINVENNYYSHGARDSSWNIGLRKLVIHKYDLNFNILKADTLGRPGHDNYPFIEESIDYRNNEILVGGHLDGPYNHPDLDKSIKKFYLAKYDENLNQIWYKEYGGDRAYLMNGLHLLNDGSSLTYGFVTDTSNDVRYAYVMHVNVNGEILSTISLPIGSKTSLQIVNPGDETLRILNPDHVQAQIQLYDIQGCHVLTGEINSEISEIDTQGLPAGLYPYVLIQDGHSIGSGKWIKAK